MWKETANLLVSGVRLNGKRYDKGDVESKTGEICVLFHCSLLYGDILGGRRRDARLFIVSFVRLDLVFPRVVTGELVPTLFTYAIHYTVLHLDIYTRVILHAQNCFASSQAQ